MVRDLGAPGARLLEIDLPDGHRVQVAEHLCGWTPAADPDGPLWPTMADAVAALSGRTRDGEPWISVLEEFAASPANPGGEMLPAAEDARLAALLRVAGHPRRRPARPQLGRLVHVHRRAAVRRAG